LAEIPAVGSALRRELAEEAERLGPLALWRQLEAVDPAYAARTPAANRQRVLRALEVARATGRPFSSWHAQAPTRLVGASLSVVLEPSPDWLTARLQARARAMVGPLLAEVAALRRGGLAAAAPGLAALGYREAWAALECAEAGGRPGLADAEQAALAEALLRAHRRYAKRQRTWFRQLERATRLDPAAPDLVERAAEALGAYFAASHPARR
jgi:tRNA dimethylallyltransferase